MAATRTIPPALNRITIPVSGGPDDQSGPPERRWYETIRFGLALAVVTAAAGCVNLLGGAFSFTPIAAAAGAVASLSLLWRFRFPRTIGAVTVVLGSVSAAAAPAMWCMLFINGLRSPRRDAIILGSAAIAGAGIFLAANVQAYLTVHDPIVVGALSIVQVVMMTGSIATGLLIGNNGRRENGLRDQVIELLEREDSTRARVRTDERHWLALDMHDAIGHRLALLRMHATVIESRQLLTDEELRATVARLGETVDAAIADLRQTLDRLTLPGDDKRLAAERDPWIPVQHRLDELDQIDRPVQVSINLDWSSLPSAYQNVLARFALEALTNAVKHGNTGIISMHISLSNELVAEVRSPLARGFRQPSRRGLGLIALKESAILLGGHLDVTVQDRQFVLTTVLPAPAAQN